MKFHLDLYHKHVLINETRDATRKWFKLEPSVTKVDSNKSSSAIINRLIISWYYVYVSNHGDRWRGSKVWFVTAWRKTEILDQNIDYYLRNENKSASTFDFQDIGTHTTGLINIICYNTACSITSSANKL